jgi:hypothetical protein
MILLTIPIFYPVAVGLGYDPIWFGVVIVLITEMGVITPPVGVNVYVVSGVAKDVPLETIFKGILPARGLDRLQYHLDHLSSDRPLSTKPYEIRIREVFQRLALDQANDSSPM